MTRAAANADNGLSPGLPPGCALEPIPMSNPLPQGYAGQILRVDWTQPLLAARLVNALGEDPTIPSPLLERAERADRAERGPVLRVQLSEPVQGENEAWRLALPMAAPPVGAATAATTEEAGALRQWSWLGLAERGGWLPGGLAVADRPDWRVPWPAVAGGRVAARWLGIANDLDAMPSVEFEGFCLMSWTRPDEGATRLMLLKRTMPGPGRLGELSRWLKLQCRPSDWLAIHAVGSQAWVGAQGWRLTSPGDPRRPQRMGGVLELTARRPGETVDWARMPGVVDRASSSEPGCDAERVLRGAAWPSPLGAGGWTSLPRADADEEAPWIEVTLDRPRPVSAIQIAWGTALGWSARFNPGRCLLQVEADVGRGLQEPVAIVPGAGPTSLWQSPRPVVLRRARLSFPDPSRERLDGRARVAAIAVLGPLGEDMAR